jgi:hypothetical protein
MSDPCFPRFQKCVRSVFPTDNTIVTSCGIALAWNVRVVILRTETGLESEADAANQDINVAVARVQQPDRGAR